MLRNESFVLILMLRTKVSGMKVPGDKCSRERKFQGTKVPPMELSFPGTKVLGYESFSCPSLLVSDYCCFAVHTIDVKNISLQIKNIKKHGFLLL